jgi:cell wall-associated NlpC family hydrolase
MFRIERERLELEIQYGPIQAVLHSHPYELANSKWFVQQHYNPAWPSEHDQQGFINDDVPWGITATDGEGISELVWLTEETQPIESRIFSWFTADCYSLVRDWHKLNTGIVLPNFTRKWGFWREGINSIEEGILKIPFATKHPTEKAQVGDVAVINEGGASVVNHLGVINGNNKFLHQFVERYAHETRWDQYAKKTQYVVRFTP